MKVFRRPIKFKKAIVKKNGCDHVWKWIRLWTGKGNSGREKLRCEDGLTDIWGSDGSEQLKNTRDNERSLVR